MNEDYYLFLGFPLSETYEMRLNQIPFEVRSAFIQNGSDYLQFVTDNGKNYLGKALSTPVEFSSLEIIQDHLYSLLKRLISDYSYENSSLVLLTLPFKR